MPVKPEKPLKSVPALETTGIGIARLGTGIWALVAMVALLWPDSPDGLAQSAVAGTFLGIIGIVHVTRRARKLGLATQGLFPR